MQLSLTAWLAMKWKDQSDKVYEQKLSKYYICSVFLMKDANKYSQKFLYMIK